MNDLDFVTVLLSILRDGSLFPLTCAVGLALIIASQCTENEPTIALRGHAIGLIAMVGWSLWILISGGVQTASDLLWNVVVRGALAGGLVTAAACVILMGITVLWPESAIRRACNLVHRIHWPRRRTRSLPYYPPNERETQLTSVDHSSNSKEEQADADRQRIADLSFGIVLQFEQNRRQLEPELTRDRLQGVLDEFIKGESSVEAVERRCGQLRAMMQTLIERSTNEVVPGFDSVVEIAAHYSAQRRTIEELDGFGGPDQDVLLNSIDEAEQSAVQEFLKRN